MANITEVMLTDIMHRKDYVRTSSGDREKISGLDNYKEALFRRLVTEPGSLIHRPGYGVGIKRFLGALASLSKQRELAGLIQEQFLQDPRTDSVSGVLVQSNVARPDMTYIIVRVRPVGYDEIAIKFEPFGA